jgi:hypothetical protein
MLLMFFPRFLVGRLRPIVNIPTPQKKSFPPLLSGLRNIPMDLALVFFVLVGFPGHFLIASLHLSIVYALVFHSPFIRYFATVDYLPIFHWV